MSLVLVEAGAGPGCVDERKKTDQERVAGQGTILVGYKLKGLPRGVRLTQHHLGSASPKYQVLVRVRRFGEAIEACEVEVQRTSSPISLLSRGLFAR